MMQKKERIREEWAIILDFLPHGYALDKRPSYMKTAIAQAIGKDHFILLELVPKKGIQLMPLEEVYIGPEKRDKIQHILGKLPFNKLTSTARTELEHVVKDIVRKNEKRFVDFFNNAKALTIRTHQLELLPGVGKKHMQEILNAREEKPFESFEDIKKRVSLLPDPENAIVKRILKELEGEEKHYLFVGK